MSLAYLEGQNFEKILNGGLYNGFEKKTTNFMFLAIFKNKLALFIYGEKRMETDHISVNIGST
jgi:hypothetical protein